MALSHTPPTHRISYPPYQLLVFTKSSPTYSVSVTLTLSIPLPLIVASALEVDEPYQLLVDILMVAALEVQGLTGTVASARPDCKSSHVSYQKT